MALWFTSLVIELAPYGASASGFLCMCSALSETAVYDGKLETVTWYQLISCPKWYSRDLSSDPLIK